jgi:hypothetical protein
MRTGAHVEPVSGATIHEGVHEKSRGSSLDKANRSSASLHSSVDVVHKFPRVDHHS